MHSIDLMALLTVLAAACGYINHRVLRLPPTVGFMALTLAFSLALLGIGAYVPAVAREARVVVEQLSFDRALLHGMLGFLLFAGALEIDLDDLRVDRGPIAVLATAGVLISTAIVGGLTWSMLHALGSPIRPIDALLFGALISPTDPIAVLAILKRIGAPKALETQIAGESLFNDGVGVAVFVGLLEVASGEQGGDLASFAALFGREAVGGAVLGFAAGSIVYLLMKSIDHFRLEVLLSVALVAGGYSAAEHLHVSGPIAMVVAGLLIGNHGRSFAMSGTTIEHLDRFWGVVDDFLNAALFVMIGVEALVVALSPRHLAAGILAIAIVLAARFLSVGVPILALQRRERFDPSLIPILTWGGLRGGISVALALSLRGLDGAMPATHRELIVSMTYVVVVFSILVQGMTIGPITRLWLPGKPGAARPRAEAEGGEPVASLPGAD